MTPGKQVARRLALYLISIGVPPVPSASSYKRWGAALQIQYNALGVDQRRLARQTGRRLIREFGSIAKANTALTNHVVREALAINTPPVASPSRNRSREEQFLHRLSRWSPLTPPCGSCRMGCGFPKRTYPSRQWADEVRGRQHDCDNLHVFECPVQPGLFHLAHKGSRHADQPIAPQKSALPSIPPDSLPPIPFQTGGHA
jgi:hypothetical protein